MKAKGKSKTPSKRRSIRGISFGCPDCDFSSTTERGLECHTKAMHLGLRPHPCKDCNYNAVTRYALEKHVESFHLQLKPFSCEECDYKAATRSKVDGHVDSVHRGLKPFPCPECSFRASQRSNLKGHMMRVHKTPDLFVSYKAISDYVTNTGTKGKKGRRKLKKANQGKPKPPARSKKSTGDKIQMVDVNEQAVLEMKRDVITSRYIDDPSENITISHQSDSDSDREMATVDSGKGMITMNIQPELFVINLDNLDNLDNEQTQIDLKIKELDSATKDLSQILTQLHEVTADPTTAEHNYVSGTRKSLLKVNRPVSDKQSVGEVILKLEEQTTEKTSALSVKSSYTCSECDFSTLSKRGLGLHMKSMHLGLRPFACSECSYKAVSRWVLEHHVSSFHRKVKPFACSTCDYKASTKKKVAVHFDTVHKGLKPYPCPECNFTASQKSNLKGHIIRTHGGANLSNLSFSDDTNESHTENHIGLNSEDDTKMHVAEPAGKSDQSKGAVQFFSIINRDGGEIDVKPIVAACTPNDLALGDRSVPQLQRVSSDHSPLIKSEGGESDLDQFIIEMDEESTDQMEGVDQTNGTNANITIKEEHNKQALVGSNGFSSNSKSRVDIQCTECSFTTTTKKGLNLHTKSMHLGLRPYPCTECDYRSVTRYALEKHVNAYHKKMRPFACDNCDYKAATKTKIDIHVTAVHKGLRPYKCPECDFRASQRSNLKGHISRTHRGATTSSAEEIVNGNGHVRLQSVSDHEMTESWDNSSESSSSMPFVPKVEEDDDAEMEVKYSDMLNAANGLSQSDPLSTGGLHTVTADHSLLPDHHVKEEVEVEHILPD